MKTLAHKTRDYWIVSCAWNGKPVDGKSMTTDKALRSLREVLINTGPQRRLVSRVHRLNQEIIQGRKEVKRAQR